MANDESFSMLFVDWLGSERSYNGHRDPTLAELKILVGGHCATTVEDFLAKSIRNSIRVSLLTLTEWLVANWWRLRYEPSWDTLWEEPREWRLAHSLKAAGHGFVWPGLRIAGDDDSVHVSMISESLWHEGFSNIRYLDAFSDQIVRATDYEKAVDEMVTLVLARVDSVGSNEETRSLRELWKEVREERDSSEKAAFRKFEAILGYESGEAPDAIVEQVLRATESIGSSSAGEIASSAKKSVTSALKDLNDALAQTKMICDASPINALRQRIEVRIEAETPWKIGWDYAHLARSSWDLGTSPVSNRQLGQLFGIEEREFGGYETLRPAIRLGIGARDKQDARLNVALSTHRPEARRFEFARMLGDAMNVGFDDVWRPVTNMKTRRQQMQRGFAAEFLCPTESLAEYFSKRGLTALSDSDIDDASQEFQVSTLVIEHQIENHLYTIRSR
jgi:hypothetical protein